MTHIIKEERIGNQRLILGDCISVMPMLGRFDAVVTDPPYGVGAASGDFAPRGSAKPRDYAGGKTWDNAPATARHMAIMRSLSEHQIIFGGNYFEGLGPTSCWLVWDKQNTGEFADCELAWTNLPKAVRRIYWRWNGMIRKGDDVRVHPTQKPVGVMEWCLQHIPEATTILDPFAGSGTTLVACQRLGRRGTGIELDPDYFAIACKRVDEAARQPDLLIPETHAKPEQTAIDFTPSGMTPGR